MYPDWLKNLFIFSNRKLKDFLTHESNPAFVILSSINYEAWQIHKANIKPGGEAFNSDFMDQSHEKLIFYYLVTKLLALYGIRIFITTVRSALPWDTSVRSKSTCLVSLSYIIILFFHLGLPNGLFVSDDSLKFCAPFTTFSVRLFQILERVFCGDHVLSFALCGSAHKPIFPSA